jgi:hypothetical protein
MRWCNYQAENEMADFADVLYRAIVNVRKKNDWFDFLEEFDNTTPVISFERGGIGSFENISFGYSLKFNQNDSFNRRGYFRIGKIIQASGSHNIYIWFPVTKKQDKCSENDEWYKRIEKKYSYDAPFTFGDAPEGQAWIGMSHVYRSEFFSDPASGLVPMSSRSYWKRFSSRCLPHEKVPPQKNFSFLLRLRTFGSTSRSTILLPVRVRG